MIKPICKDTIFLSQKSVPASKADLSIVDDLLDTLKANTAGCVGMAANMIGVNKRIIVFSLGSVNIPMINPIITKRAGPYETEEGCLSLSGTRKTTRYHFIEVEYLDRNLKSQKQNFTDWTAQIIQHEMDHCEGVLI